MGHYEKLMSAVPVNSNAANAIKGGISFDESRVAKPCDHSLVWDSRPPLASKEKMKSISDNPSFVDFTGVRIGRVTVVGISEAPSGRAKWVVRCDCGIFETRRTKTIKAKNPNEKCQRCMNIDSMKYHNSSIVGRGLSP